MAFARAAARAGADWVILQPPAARGTSPADLIRFFGAVAEAVDVPVAVQNNPVNLDVSLSVDALVELNRAHPNIRILKGEGWSVDIARAIEGSGGAYAVMGGHGGIELPALLRSGGAGLIPAPDFLPAHVAMWRAWREGRRDEAEAIHRRILPAIVFTSRSVPGIPIRVRCRGWAARGPGPRGGAASMTAGPAWASSGVLPPAAGCGPSALRGPSTGRSRRGPRRRSRRRAGGRARVTRRRGRSMIEAANATGPSEQPRVV